MEAELVVRLPKLVELAVRLIPLQHVAGLVVLEKLAALTVLVVRLDAQYYVRLT